MLELVNLRKKRRREKGKWMSCPFSFVRSPSIQKKSPDYSGDPSDLKSEIQAVSDWI
jgi:hypothetical protein